MPNRRDLRPVPPPISDETIRRIELLLEQAKRGEVLGVAYIAQGPKTYTIDAVGICNDRPLLTRAMLLELDDLLHDRMKPPPRH